MLTLLQDQAGKRLPELVWFRFSGQAVLALECRITQKIFGSPEDLKLKSCMTPFEVADGPDSVFSIILEKYFKGQHDERSLTI